MLHLQFHLTEEEYYDYNYYTAWAAPERRKYRIGYYLKVILLYGGVAGLYVFAKKIHRQLFDILIFTGIALIYVLLIPLLVKRSVKRRAKQIIAQPENKHILSECEVILMDTGIVDKDKETESKYNWDAIVKTGETPKSYFLYTNSHHAIVIPKRTLKNSGDKKELLRLMNEHLPLNTDFQGKL